MLRHLPIAIFLLASSIASGQTTIDQERCTAHSITKRFLQQQGLSTDLQAALPRVQDAHRGDVFTVPVVVHVVYNTPSENVPNSAIFAMVNEMNEDFSQSNADIGGVRSAFTSSIANVGIQFCLAQVDPMGNTTTGITRTATTDTWFDPDTQTDAMKSAPLGIAPWNTSEYLNIWICDITSGATGGSITLGFAYLPVGGVVGSNIDGLVVDYQYGLPVGSRTATHEIGHYFGLDHPWADGNCSSDDGFTDTPNTDSPTYSCANTTLQKCGTLTQYENFMDYSNCPVMYTAQQRSYMRGLLSGVRSSLLDSPGCSGGGPVEICIPTSANGTSEGDFINGVTLGSINNTNSGGITGPSYTDYSTTMSAALIQSSTHTITIQGGDYQPDHYAAWIDYDQDDAFEASEKLGEFVTDQSGQSGTITFTVPADAIVGITTMRVRGVYHNTGEPTPTDPCYNYGYGETEDYAIEIIPGGGAGVCVPTSENGTTDGDFINGVTLGTINNTNSGGITGPSYTDYGDLFTTDLQQGSTHTITIQGGDYEPDHYAAWIDYDQNDLFSNAEKLGEFVTSASGETGTITFTVPADALIGETTLRVRGVYHNEGDPSPTDPCYSYAYGETEDYGIVITEGMISGTCIPTSEFGTSDGDFINSVILQEINNSNTGSSTGPTYTDYTLMSATLIRGGSYEMTIQGGDYSPDNYAAWIDMDGDEIFTLSEKLGEFSTSGAMETGTISFTVPNTAQLGTTTLRVRGVYHGEDEPAPSDPCFAYAYGETEDYSVLIEQSTSIDPSAAQQVMIFPNPATDQLTVQLGVADPAVLSIMDALGRVVATHRSNSITSTIPLQELAAGHYFVRVEQGTMVHVLPLQVAKD